MLRRKFMQFAAMCVPSMFSGWLPKATVKPAEPLTLFGLPMVEIDDLSQIGPINIQADRYLDCTVYVGRMVDGVREWRKIERSNPAAVTTCSEIAAELQR